MDPYELTDWVESLTGQQARWFLRFIAVNQPDQFREYRRDYDSPTLPTIPGTGSQAK